MSDAAFPLFLTASISFPDPVRDLIRQRKAVRIREAFLLLMGKLREQPLPIDPDVESVMDGSLRGEYIAQLTSPPFLVLAKSRFFLFSYSEKGAGAALVTVIRTAKLDQADSDLCPHTAWKDQPGRHRQTSSMVRKPSGRGEVIEIRGTEEHRG